MGEGGERRETDTRETGSRDRCAVHACACDPARAGSGCVRTVVQQNGTASKKNTCANGGCCNSQKQRVVCGVKYRGD